MAEWGIMTLVLLSGLLGGVVFPLSAQIILRTKRRTGRAAGAVDAADHVGACIGALIAGVVLIPALGIIETCVFLAVLKVLSALFLLFARH